MAKFLNNGSIMRIYFDIILDVMKDKILNKTEKNYGTDSINQRKDN